MSYDPAASIAQKEAQRKHFLHELYRVTDGNPRELVIVDSFFDELGLSKSEARVILNYLGGEGLVRYATSAHITITHKGVRAVEAESLNGDAGNSPDSARPTPPDIRDSLLRFQADHPDAQRTAFIMMRFGSSRLHSEITEAIRSALEPHGITGLRADDKEYHEDLYPNILTYMYGCGFGIAVFERIETNEFNPNVSLEVGYLSGLGKPVCLLKDRTLQTLQTDLVGKLYRQFDPHDASGTIPKELSRWLSDRNLIG